MRTNLSVSDAMAARLHAVYAYLSSPSAETSRAVRVTYAELAYAVRFASREVTS